MCESTCQSQIDDDKLGISGASGSAWLDETVFPQFGALLAAGQDYARLSGCRFILHSFRGIFDGHKVIQSPAEGSGPMHAAKLRIAPEAERFAERLRKGDAELAEELEKAVRVAGCESTRNAMIVTLQVLDMWPPKPSPTVYESDRNYRDLTAPLPVIAQRAYNEQMWRLQGPCSSGDARREAWTASFLVDFATEIGVLPEVLPESERRFFREFSALAAVDKDTQKSPTKKRRVRQEQREDRSVASLDAIAADLQARARATASSWWNPAPTESSSQTWWNGNQKEIVGLQNWLIGNHKELVGAINGAAAAAADVSSSAKRLPKQVLLGRSGGDHRSHQRTTQRGLQTSERCR